MPPLMNIQWSDLKFRDQNALPLYLTVVFVITRVLFDEIYLPSGIIIFIECRLYVIES